MSTVRPRVMKMPQKDPGYHGEIRPIEFTSPDDSLPEIIEFIPKAELGDADIAKAPVLVVVGKGACDAKHLPMLEELARAMGDTSGASADYGYVKGLFQFPFSF